MTTRIVLTRTSSQPHLFATKLRQLGYAVTLFPLLETAPLPPTSPLQAQLHTTLANLSQYHLAIFVSPNAIQAVFQAMDTRPWPSHLPIAVMGNSSRTVLLQCGVNEKTIPIYCPSDPYQSDSEALLALLDLPALKGRQVLIFCAAGGRTFLADALRQAGIHVINVLAYQRFASPITPENNQLLLSLLTAPTHWVISSSEALRILGKRIKTLSHNEAQYTSYQEHMILWITHRRIAETAKHYGFPHHHLTGSGDDNLLTALTNE